MATTKRKFIKTLGLGLLALPFLRWVMPSASEDEEVPLLTSDGKLVHVKRSTLDKSKKVKVSNQRLYSWMKSGKASDNYGSK
ncbi:MAG: hypothetical protein HQ500_09280 [Flavobacteriales bacterium]|nr:hypothetical protein [Flavobacteriales bacterium]